MFQLQNIYKLFTKEDEYHVHKFLGGFCLLNFIYRFYNLLSCGTMFLDNSVGLYSILLHGLLSISSLQFHISNTRNPSKPMIYPEFRMHSILFGLRSVIVCLLYYYHYNYKYIIATSYSVLFLSDFITKHYNIDYKNGNTMRNMPFEKDIREEKKQQITRMHSIMQIGATIFMLGNINSAFSPLFAIQTAAFLMTLVRKSIITTNTWHLLYSAGLFANYLLFPTFSPGFLLFIALVLFFHEKVVFFYKINKYLAWGFHYSVFVIYRDYGYELWINDFFLNHHYLCWILMKLFIIYKCASFYKNYSIFM